MPELPKIYVMRLSDSRMGDAPAVALLADGTLVASHVSSSTEWARLDMACHPVSPNGAGSKKSLYAQHCPEGYELVDLLDYPLSVLRAGDAHPEARAALERYKEAA